MSRDSTPQGSGTGGPGARQADVRERLVWRAAVLMLLAVTGWLFYTAYDAVERAEELEAELQELQERQKVEGLQGLGALGLSTRGVRLLEAAGVTGHPEAHLLQEVGERWGDHDPGAEAGGRFLPEQSVVLNDHWILAVFETEETRAAAVLRFRIDEEGRLSWTPEATVADLDRLP